MYNKTIITFGFRDNLNNQGLGSADNTYLVLNYSGYHKNLIQYFIIIQIKKHWLDNKLF